MFRATARKGLGDDVSTVQLAGADGQLARPHLGALQALLGNPKLPTADRRRVEKIGLPAYEAWRATLATLSTDGPADPRQLLAAMVAATDAYKRVVDLELIYDSTSDFLPRQAGQLKLSSTVLEEFLPTLVIPALVGELPDGLTAGPHRALTALAVDLSGRVSASCKNQDFAVARHIELATTTDDGCTATSRVAVPLVAVECKTNLDATMFAGASATGTAMSRGVPKAAFFLVTEWLDMAPQTTAGTGIARALVLRGRRPAACDRWTSKPAAERAAERAQYAQFLADSPLRAEPLEMLVDAIAERLHAGEDPVSRGWF